MDKRKPCDIGIENFFASCDWICDWNGNSFLVKGMTCEDLVTNQHLEARTPWQQYWNTHVSKLCSPRLKAFGHFAKRCSRLDHNQSNACVRSQIMEALCPPPLWWAPPVEIRCFSFISVTVEIIKLNVLISILLRQGHAQSGTAKSQEFRRDTSHVGCSDIPLGGPCKGVRASKVEQVLDKSCTKVG